MDKPSSLIRSHIEGRGSGYELDDLMSGCSGGVYDEITDRVVAIHRKYRTEAYRIGTSNPESFPALEELALELEQRGL